MHQRGLLIAGVLRIAPHFQTSTRRMELAGARRETLHADDHSIAKVGLEPEAEQERTDPRMQEQETPARSGIVHGACG